MDYDCLDLLEFCDDLDLLDIIEEMAISPSNSIKNMFEHMIKYVCNPSKQTASWVNTIIRSYKELMANRKNIKNIDLDKEYMKAYKDASKLNNVPYELENRPYDWNLNSIMNINWISDFLHNNYNQNLTYQIDLDEKINSIIKK